jgi:hypothetical protein
VTDATPDRPTRDLRALIEGFERATLPKERWTHAAHLTVALWYVRDAGAEGALARMREGILRYVAAIGADPAAYHETVTRAWVEVLAAFDRAHGGMGFAEASRVAVERFGDKLYLRRHYSPERIASPEARAGWLPPDREPIESPRRPPAA